MCIRGCGHGRSDGPRSGGNQDTSDKKPTCQVCGKVEHTALKCWFHFDQSYQAELDQVAFTTDTTLYNVDTNWYVDSRATDHLIKKLNKLTLKEKYHGKDKVQVVNVAGLSITHIG